MAVFDDDQCTMNYKDTSDNMQADLCLRWAHRAGQN